MMIAAEIALSFHRVRIKSAVNPLVNVISQSFVVEVRHARPILIFQMELHAQMQLDLVFLSNSHTILAHWDVLQASAPTENLSASFLADHLSLESVRNSQANALCTVMM
jgi:hypothetical protein